MIPKLCGNIAPGTRLGLGLTPGAAYKQRKPPPLQTVSALHVCAGLPACTDATPGSCACNGAVVFAELTCALLTHTCDLSTSTQTSWHADYWQTLSSCLTDLHLKVDAGHAEELQPCLLKGLSRLTFLKFELTYDDESGCQCDNLPQLELPELRQLVVGHNRWVSQTMDYTQGICHR